MKVDLRPKSLAPRAPLDVVAAAGVKYTPPPTFGDAFSAAKYVMRQRALEESTSAEFVVSCSCSITTSDERRFVEGVAISPRDVHREEARARAALQALAMRGIVIHTDPADLATRKAVRR